MRLTLYVKYLQPTNYPGWAVIVYTNACSCRFWICVTSPVYVQLHEHVMRRTHAQDPHKHTFAYIYYELSHNHVHDLNRQHHHPYTIHLYSALAILICNAQKHMKTGKYMHINTSDIQIIEHCDKKDLFSHPYSEIGRLRAVIGDEGGQILWIYGPFYQFYTANWLCMYWYTSPQYRSAVLFKQYGRVIWRMCRTQSRIEAPFAYAQRRLCRARSWHLLSNAWNFVLRNVSKKHAYTAF